MAAAAGAAGGITLADLFNVIHFEIDEASKSEIESSIESLKDTLQDAMELKVTVDDSADTAIQDVEDTVSDADLDAPIKPTVDEASKDEAIGEIQAMKSTITKILSVVGITFGLAQFRDITEEFNGINDSITYATKGMGNQKEIQQDILQAANDCKATYGDLATYAVTLAQQNEDLFPIDEATEFAKLVNQVEQSAGKGDSVQTVKTLMSSIFATGELSAATLTRLEKKAPEVVNVICDGLGVTKEQLENMADAGQVSAETVKDAYLAASDSIQESFDGLDYSISDALTSIRNKWGNKLDEMNVKFGLTEKIARTIVRVSDMLERGFDTVVEVITKVSDAVGGMDNLFQLIAVSVGAFMLAWKGEKIISGLKSITSLLNPMNLKIMMITAAIVAIFLVVQDFITFLQGGDSVFGELLEGAGADVDEVRENFLDFFDSIKQVAGDVITAMGDWWDTYGDDVIAAVQSAWQVVQGVFTMLYGIFTGIAGFIDGIINGDISEAIDSLGDMWDKVCEGIDQAARALFGDGLVDAVEGFIDTAGSALETFFGWISDAIGGIGDFFSGIGDSWNNFWSGGNNPAGGTAGGSSLTNAAGAGKAETNNTNTVNQNVNNTFNVSDRGLAVAASGAVTSASNGAYNSLSNQLKHTGR